MKIIVWIGMIVWASLLHAYAYSDYDVDGVEDSIDLCPHTPFDKLVDEDGCEEGKGYQGSWSLQTGMMIAVDTNNSTLSNARISIQYTYKKWDISLSTFRDIDPLPDEDSQTLYMSIGHTQNFWDEVEVNVALGMKYSSAQNDYYATLNMIHSLDSDRYVSFFYSYTLPEDSTLQKYNNYHTLSLGYSQQITAIYLTGLSYQFSTASTVDTNAYHALTWENTLRLSERYYLLGSYSLGLSEDASDHLFNLQFGVDFD